MSSRTTRGSLWGSPDASEAVASAARRSERDFMVVGVVVARGKVRSDKLGPGSGG